jgi:hypothetical protein
MTSVPKFHCNRNREVSWCLAEQSVTKQRSKNMRPVSALAPWSLPSTFLLLWRAKGKGTERNSVYVVFINSRLCLQLYTSPVFNIYQRTAKLKRSHSYKRQHNYKDEVEKTYNLQKPAGLPDKIFVSVTVGHPESSTSMIPC